MLEMTEGSVSVQDRFFNNQPAVFADRLRVEPVEGLLPIVQDIQNTSELYVRTGSLDSVSWRTYPLARIPRNFAGQAVVGVRDLASYLQDDFLTHAFQNATEAFSPAANNGYRTDHAARKISVEAFTRLFDYTQALADATGKPVSAIQSGELARDVATMFRLKPGMTKNDYIHNAAALLESTVATLSTDKNIHAVYPVGSLITETYATEQRLPSDVDVVVVVNKANNLDCAQPSPLIRHERYEDKDEDPHNTLNKPIQRFLRADTISRLNKHAERTGVSLHLVLFTQRMWAATASSHPPLPVYNSDIAPVA